MSQTPPASPPVEVARGVCALRRLLRDQTRDLRRLDLTAFRPWLDSHLARWQRDPVFLQRARIRDLRRRQPLLRSVENEHRLAAAAEAASPQCSRLRRLEQELIDTDKAVSGLTTAIQQATLERRPAVRQKLEAFLARQVALREEQRELILSSPERQTLVRIEAEWQQLRSGTGLDREEDRLDGLLKQQGRRFDHSGDSFEEQAFQLTQNCFLPDLLRGCPSGEAVQRVRVLRGVTLGAARTEFDQLVIRQPRRIGSAVEVLAVVEVKRNINDVAHGFRQRQENLAWLTGDESQYDAGLYRTGHFRSGHFDRHAIHEQDGEAFLFAPGSFRRLRRGPGADAFLDRLYLITRPGVLWGISTANLARIGYRVATDDGWQPDSDAYLGGLLRWCQSFAGEIETPDVLQLYIASPQRGRRVLLANTY
jgi:hypothetical protein